MPGSHLWAHDRLPKLEEAKAAEMEVGEAFLFLASTVHGGGANMTDASRTVHGFFFCRSYLRPEVLAPPHSSDISHPEKQLLPPIADL